MQRIRKNGSTSNVERAKLRSSTSGQGLVGLSHLSAGLIISIQADNEATPTAYAVAGSTIETIATLGTYAAPTATKCRFREIDADDCPGDYEFQFANARYAVSGAKFLKVHVIGATDLLEKEFTIQLTTGGDIGVDTTHVSGTAQTAGDIPARLPSALIGGRMDSNLQAAADDVLTADKFDSTYYPAIWNTASIDVTDGIGDFIRDTLTNLSDRLTLARAEFLDNLDVGGNLVDAILDEPIADHDDAGSVGEAIGAAGATGDPWTTTLPGSYTGSQAGKMLSDIYSKVDTEIAGILAAVDTEIGDIQSRLPAALIGGRIDATVGAMQNNVMTAAAAASDLATELQAGLATQVSVDDLPTIAELAIALAAADDAVLAELAKVPKSDGSTTWNATALASIQSEATDALNAYDPPTRAEATSDKNEIVSDLADIATDLGDVLINTGTTLPAQIAALLTTAGAESYRADGATGSVFQLLYEIMALVGEFGIVGTTKQQKKIDGSSNAFASTLDSATSPTSITRGLSA